jgi:hypothetical protein
MSKKHPCFKAVAKREHVSSKRARAILASATRHDSAATKRKKSSPQTRQGKIEMGMIRRAIFSLALLCSTCGAAFAQDANQVPNVATFRANAYGGTVWLAGTTTPGDGGGGYFLPNGKQSVTHCVDNGSTVIVDKNGTCWERQSGSPITPSKIINVTSDYTVTTSDVASGECIIDTDASSNQITITVPPDLGSSNSVPTVIVEKTDTSSNIVLISNGTNIVDAISSPASSIGQISGWRFVYPDGTDIHSLGVG